MFLSVHPLEWVIESSFPPKAVSPCLRSHVTCNQNLLGGGKNEIKVKNSFHYCFLFQPPLWGEGAFFCHSVDTKDNLNYKNVLDLYFKINPELCFSPDMVSPRDHEMMATEKTVCCTVSKRRGMPYHAGPHREAPGLVSKQKEWGERVEESLYCGFSWKGTSKAE